jgi:hypothetical protein
VLRHDLGWVEPPEDVPRITARLAALVDAWCAGKLRRETALVAELSAPVQVERLAHVLEKSGLQRASSCA